MVLQEFYEFYSLFEKPQLFKENNSDTSLKEKCFGLQTNCILCSGRWFEFLLYNCHMTCHSRVVGRQQEVEQQADGVFHVDLVSCGHALVQLVNNGGQHHLQASHSELGVEVHSVEPVLAESLDDVPNINQMHWKRKNTM